jgi:hypothetical protein
MLEQVDAPKCTLHQTRLTEQGAYGYSILGRLEPDDILRDFGLIHVHGCLAHCSLSQNDVALTGDGPNQDYSTVVRRHANARPLGSVRIWGLEPGEPRREVL